MNNILDQFNAAPSSFRPRTASECFALMLAAKLGDTEHVPDYVKLCSEYPRGKLLSAYHRTIRSGQHPASLDQFKEDLLQPSAQFDDDETKLIALKAERRTIAIAGFTGDRLDFTNIVHLSSNRDKAFACAVGFLSKHIAHFRPDSATVEGVDDEDTQRADLMRTLVAVLRRHMLPVWTVTKHTLFEAFGKPTIKTRDELREVAGTIWPIFPGWGTHSMERDAAMLGLHVQLGRPFMPQSLTVPV